MQDASTSVFDLQHDFAILDRYQGFSGELIRLALAGMAAVGLFVAWFVGTDHRPYDRAVSGELPVLSLFIALVSFGVSAAFALGHRYWSTDSMSAYVAMLRSLAKSAGAVDVPGGSPADARARVGAEGKPRRCERLVTSLCEGRHWRSECRR